MCLASRGVTCNTYATSLLQARTDLGGGKREWCVGSVAVLEIGSDDATKNMEPSLKIIVKEGHFTVEGRGENGPCAVSPEFAEWQDGAKACAFSTPPKQALRCDSSPVLPFQLRPTNAQLYLDTFSCLAHVEHRIFDVLDCLSISIGPAQHGTPSAAMPTSRLGPNRDLWPSLAPHQSHPPSFTSDSQASPIANAGR